MPRIFALVLFIMCAVLVPLGAQEKPLVDMVWVEGGTFMMGRDAENPGISTTLSSFWIGKTEVTQKQWRDVMGTNPSYFKGDNLPVEKVDWFDAAEFCNNLSQKEGLSLAYRINGPEVILNSGATGYRLPTEAQWEFAARGGNASRGSTYSGGNTAESQGWVSTNSGDKTQAVGTKGANELGIYDMSGNVWEWCYDWHTGSLTGGRDPVGPAAGVFRVMRSGSWYNKPGRASVSHRSWAPGARYDHVGFRVVRP